MSKAALNARPGKPTSAIRAGLHALGTKSKREGLLYVPAGYDAGKPIPLVLTLHGAGGDARNGLVPLQPFADSFGLALLAAGSREETWDIIRGEYGPDVEFIDGLLEETFRRCAIDRDHIATEGFSDGASYALSIGLSNGDLFTHIIAFSPGFMAPARQEGTPRIFISHGLHDTVLSIARCSRNIVPALERAGYDVTYVEFAEGHTVPHAIALRAVEWFTTPRD